MLSATFDLDIENGLVRLEDHPIFHFEVLVEVEPGAVRTRLVVEAVCENPGLLLSVETDICLALRQQFVIYFYVAVGSSSNDDRLSCVFLLVVVDLAS